MTSPAVSARSLGKDYEVYRKPADRILEMVTFSKKHETFPALRDLDFEISKGESVGIIGQNGAGKSTLLKIVGGVVRPTRGSLEVDGKVASILELGTGFHPDFTGRDNAALNTAILGLGPREIAAALPKIFDFSELGQFLDRPVRTYSSGMYMRLAFSVAVNVDPDILIIDEALAVGDGYFQKKCVDRIRELQGGGRTILFCSHALYFVSTLCNRSLWIDRGRIRADGPSVDVVHEYETSLLESNRIDVTDVDDTRDEVSIGEIVVSGLDGIPVEEIETADGIGVRVEVDTSRVGESVRVGVAVVRAADEMRCCAATSPPERTIEPGRKGQCVEIEFSSLPLTRGDYGIVVWAESAESGRLFGRRDRLPAFKVAGDRYEVGVMRLAHEWRSESR